MGVLRGQDSGLEILFGEGEDVELGARTSKHIFVFAFDPLSLNPLSLLVLCIIAFFISSYTCVVPCIIHIAYIHFMLGLCLCVPHLYLTTRASYSTSTLI